MNTSVRIYWNALFRIIYFSCFCSMNRLFLAEILDKLTTIIFMGLRDRKICNRVVNFVPQLDWANGYFKI